MPSAMLASSHISVYNQIVSDCFPLFPSTDKAANIPRFIKRSTKYEDLFGEASDSQAPLPVKPLS